MFYSMFILLVIAPLQSASGHFFIVGANPTRPIDTQHHLCTDTLSRSTDNV